MVLCLCLSSTTMAVEARSSGLLGYCDLTPVTGWPNGKFGSNVTNGVRLAPNSNVMPWVVYPKASTIYTIRAGDGTTRATDATKYTPGQTTEIHIRVSDLKYRFIGLVLYATNGTVSSKENNVGDWSFPAESPFQLPSTCGGKAVTHMSADIKPLHTRLFWTAPVGTGKVTFRVLIKQGEQNKGNFFWPSVALKLEEGPAWIAPQASGNSTDPQPTEGAVVSQTVVGDYGTACGDVCNLNYPATPYCDSAAITAIMDMVSLTNATSGQIICRKPLLAGCPFAGGAHVSDEGFCSFRPTNLDSCPAAFAAAGDDAPAKPDVCFTKAASDAQPICVCSNSAAVQPANPFNKNKVAVSSSKIAVLTDEEEDEDETSAASTAGPSMIVVLLAAFATLLAGGSKNRMSLLFVACIVVVALAQPAHGHNYIKSVHRAWEAAVSVPCQQRVGNQPHVQVVADQTFEIEWAVGHGDATEGPFYFATVLEANLYQLKRDNITAILLDYLKKSPTNASIIPTGWNKHHIRNIAEADIADATYFTVVPQTDADYIWRDPIYASLAHPSQYKNNKTVVQQRFNTTFLTKDKRASYVSELYPWLESVSVFYNPLKEHAIYNNQATIARFSAPARQGPGNYVVFFFWQGYKDCIDINVMSGTTPVVSRYGQLESTTQQAVIKIDHAEFTYVPYAATMTRKMNATTMDAKQCIAECIKLGTNCRGVQVVRGVNLATSLKYTVNLPYTVKEAVNVTKTALGIAQPCSLLSVHDRTIGGCVQKVSNNCDPAKLLPKTGDFFCYGLVPSRNQDNQVEEDFTIATEPADPVWYSTAYLMDPWRAFLDVPTLPYTKPTWVAGDDACVSCPFYASLDSLNSTQAPDWSTSLATTCRDCDLANSLLNLTAAMSKIAGANSATAGRGNENGNDGTTTTTTDASSSDSWTSNKLYLALAVIAIVGMAALLSIGLWFATKNCRAKRAANTSTNKMVVESTQADSNTWGTELSPNPAARESHSKW